MFSGFDREDYEVPVPYPVACHPQAWAAAAMPFMLETLLGLTPEAFDHRLLIIHPLLPDFIGSLEVRRLRVGNASADLRFTRASDGTIAVDVLNIAGRLDIELKPKAPSRPATQT